MTYISCYVLVPLMWNNSTAHLSHCLAFGVKTKMLFLLQIPFGYNISRVIATTVETLGGNVVGLFYT